MTGTTINQLYKTLQERKRPEDVADMVLNLLSPQLSAREKRTLQRAANGALRYRFLQYSSMAQNFAAVVGAQQQVDKTIELFHLQRPEALNATSIADVQAFVAEVAPMLNKTVGENNFLGHRLNRAQREAMEMDISKRQYNKKWRLLKRLELKLLKMQRETRKREFQQIGKHGLAHRISFEAFSSDLNTACFIAYYTARCNLRSVFTNGKQERPFDEICEMLFNRCSHKGFLKSRAINSTNWLAIAHVYTSQQVLAQLTDAEKGMLLGEWTAALQDVAQLLEEVWNASDINRSTMIVKRGNDSSTWNNTAGAWNKARDHWMHLIYAMGLESILDELCFGKVMRLMAADVAVWHRMSGGKLDPNTEVWNAVALPWEVFNGTATCTRKLVIQHCKNAGLNAEKSGWIAPCTHGVAAFKPTPELVHGVAVASPFMAKVLKQQKFFSGKKKNVFA